MGQEHDNLSLKKLTNAGEVSLAEIVFINGLDINGIETQEHMKCASKSQQL